MTTSTLRARARDIRFLTIEPGRISLHGIALTDGEYAVLRGIAERMKRMPAPVGLNVIVDDDAADDLMVKGYREAMES
ncbi:hypothetical protein [Paraburkholderia sediminicola]|uniref:hypothetical protein n=1 Tax=Paraburkholderia sediminicola TaxID=458836 RepID=UPI0038BCDAA6